jgi:hypothetical protein
MYTEYKCGQQLEHWSAQTRMTGVEFEKTMVEFKLKRWLEVCQGGQAIWRKWNSLVPQKETRKVQSQRHQRDPTIGDKKLIESVGIIQKTRVSEPVYRRLS